MIKTTNAKTDGKEEKTKYLDEFLPFIFLFPFYNYFFQSA